MPLLNAGLSPAAVRARLDKFECPKCGIRLQLLLGREWAACTCCGVDYAKAGDGAGEVVLSRYLPDGRPHCPHYAAEAPARPGKRVTIIQPFGRINPQ